MRRFQLFGWVFLAVLTLQFSACENEPLEGEFPQEEMNIAEEGQFVATVGGQSYLAELAQAVLNGDNTITIIGSKASTGEIITLNAENAGVGMFDITANDMDTNGASYQDAEQLINPYISHQSLGGSGEMELTEVNVDSMTVTGTFSFVGARFALDAQGNPIVDGNGNPVIETVEVTSGAFNKIELIIDGGQGQGGGNESDLFAVVDGEDYEAVQVTANRTEISSVPMINIVALNTEGDQIRIDIPEDLGLGTFAMESISDGTKLIGLYNSNGPGENLTSNPGTITITRFNTLVGLIDATFEFTATDPLGIDPTVVQITEGNLSVAYEPLPSNTSNSMMADVDGVELIADLVDAMEFDLSGTAMVTARGYNSSTGQFIEITFPKDIAPGSHDFVSELLPGESVATYRPQINGDPFTSTDGAIIVLSNDLSIGGTVHAGFLFFAEDLSGNDPTTYGLTNGEFIVELP